MINWIYQRIRDREHISDMYGICSLIVGFVATLFCFAFGMGHHSMLWIYGTGVIVSFFLTSSIDCDYKPSIMTDATDMRRYLVGSSFLWPGHAIMLVVVSATMILMYILSALMQVHGQIRNFKIRLPKHKVKTIKPTPMPNSDPYRSPPEVCESCGKAK